MKEADLKRLHPTIRHPGKEKAMETGERSALVGAWGQGRKRRGNTEDLGGREPPLYDPHDTSMVATQHYTLV